ncbi:hypothetical protein BH23GEM4_BH23GEM4_08840 [soil metagenome]
MILALSVVAGLVTGLFWLHASAVRDEHLVHIRWPHAPSFILARDGARYRKIEAHHVPAALAGYALHRVQLAGEQSWTLTKRKVLLPLGVRV